MTCIKKDACGCKANSSNHLAQKVESLCRIRCRLDDFFDVERLERRELPTLGPGRDDDDVTHAHLKDALAGLLSIDADLRRLMGPGERLLQTARDFGRARFECAS